MKYLTWPIFEKWRDIGLLIVRVGLGLMMIGHGWPKLLAPERWEGLGGAMSHLGVPFFPSFWGGAAAVSEVLGGALVALGLFTRPAAALVAFTMFVAWWSHVSGGDPFRSWSHSAETGLGFLLILFLGAGRFGIDTLLRKR